MLENQNKENIIILWEVDFPLLFVEKKNEEYFLFWMIKRSRMKKQKAFLRVKVKKEDIELVISGEEDLRGLFVEKEVVYIEEDDSKITETNMEFENDLIEVVNLEIIKKIFGEEKKEKEKLFPPKGIYLNNLMLMNKIDIEKQKELL